VGEHIDVIELLIDAQAGFAGFAFALAVQHGLRWRRHPEDRAARWFTLWTTTIGAALLANEWVAHANTSTVDAVSFARTLLLTGAVVTMAPTAAALGGRAAPRRTIWALVALGAARAACWPATSLMSTHRVDAHGQLVYGWLEPVVTLPVMAVVVGTLVTWCRGWEDRREHALFVASGALSLGFAVAAVFADDRTSTLLIGAFLITPVVGLQIVSARQGALRDEHEKELLDRQRRATAELCVSETRTRLALQSGSMGWWEYDAKSGAIAGSDELWAILGMQSSPPKHLGPVAHLVHVDDRRDVWAAFQLAFDTGAGHAEFRWRGTDHQQRWIEVTASRLDTEACRLVGVAQDVTERKEFEVELRHRAEHCPLTGYANRVLLRRTVEIALAEGDRFALLLIDLDRFKDVNDSLGHPFGDRVLCAVADRFAERLWAGALLARLGGDEFAVVMRADHDRATGVARRLLDAIAEPVMIDGVPVSVSASIGVVVMPEDGIDFDTVLRRADSAMYRAKRRGNTWRRYRDDDELGSVRRLALASQLAGALSRGDIDVHFQPTLHLPTNSVRSAEALARWKHAEHGWIPPNEFVTLAEHYGMGLTLFRHVLRRSLAELATWRSRGLLDVVAVNMSPHTMLDPALTVTIAAALADTGVPPSALVLEITEDSFIDDSTEVEETFQALRGLGIRLAIDDFGAGYSSLAYLKRLQVDHLKLDRSFITGLQEGTSDDAIVGLTIDVARRLGLSVIAEGVEDAETVEALRRHGCDTIQGFWWCRPAPAAEITTWLERRQDPAHRHGPGRLAHAPS
jgi:diguanylate cyclase (GGDEF)-like protein/PAS domain S-box-containing protein